MASKHQDVEHRVLAQAVKWHTEHRVAGRHPHRYFPLGFHTAMIIYQP
ncbi:hypothetical protein HMPREF9278_1913 [Mobiluncus mulieris FB024-16]|nr:hypothetical protein HMPREF9278_1913 [Mobiluncus mulieris FB024-16]